MLLLNSGWEITSVTRGDRERVFRVRVDGFRPGEEAQYTVIMRQLQGGLRDGCWMTSKVISEVRAARGRRRSARREKKRKWEDRSRAHCARPGRTNAGPAVGGHHALVLGPEV